MTKCRYVRAYHFVGATLRDGRRVPADGEWLVHDGDAVICWSGLHASREAFDALHHAPGAALCLVDCDDIVVEQRDKLVCRRRRIVARFDATEFLWEAARAWALDVAHLWGAPPVVLEYLRTGDATKRVAAHAAAYAARAAAYAADDYAAAYAARTAQRQHFNDAVADEFVRMGATP